MGAGCARLACIAVGLLAPVLAGCFTATDADPRFGPAFERARPLAFLSSTVFPDLVVEVHYETGHAPSNFAMSELGTALQNLTDKRAIAVGEPMQFGARTSAGGAWSFDALHDLGRELYRDGPCCPLARDDHGVLQVIYLGGSYEEYEGVHIDGVVFLFVDRIRESVLHLPKYADIEERNVLLHEMGHALGLVDNGVDMRHPRLYDDSSQSHSTNRASIMYGGRHDNDLARGLEDFEELEWFDRDDLADLAHFRETVATLARDHPDALAPATSAALDRRD